MLDPYYITGFTDGEGCFYISASPDSKSKKVNLEWAKIENNKLLIFF